SRQLFHSFPRLPAPPEHEAPGTSSLPSGKIHDRFSPPASGSSDIRTYPPLPEASEEAWRCWLPSSFYPSHPSFIPRYSMYIEYLGNLGMSSRKKCRNSFPGPVLCSCILFTSIYYPY